MIRRRTVIAVTLMSFLLGAARASAQPALAYRVDDLGGTSSQAFAINDSGDVAGVYLDAQNNAHGLSTTAARS